MSEKKAEAARRLFLSACLIFYDRPHIDRSVILRSFPAPDTRRDSSYWKYLNPSFF